MSGRALLVVTLVAALLVPSVVATDAELAPAAAAGVTPSLRTSLLIERWVEVPDTEAGGRARMNHMASTGSRLFLVEETDGKIYEVQPTTPPTLSLFFDVGEAIETATGRSLDRTNTFHGGLRGLAFHPDFESNGLFYTSLMETRPALPAEHTYVSDGAGTVGADSVVVEWQSSGGGTPTPASYREVFRVGLIAYDHPIKQIAFNPYATVGDSDYGLLYVAHGDGSLANTPGAGGHGNDALGKILRIDPTVGPGGEPYTVPANNPFVNDPSMIDEVYSLGHRNPHNLAFGRGDLRRVHLIVGEAGRDNAEEINLIKPGANYGWPEREGTFVHLEQPGLGTGVAQLPANDASNGYTYPAAQILHTGNVGDTSTGEAVAGGYLVDNGSALTGIYLYTDFPITGKVFGSSMRELEDATTVLQSDQAPHLLTQATSTEFALWFDADDNPATPAEPRENLRDVLDDEATYDGSGRADIRFGQGPDGSIFVLNKRNGVVYRVVNSVPPEPDQPASLCPVSFDYVLDGTGMLATAANGQVVALGAASVDFAPPALEAGEAVTAIIAEPSGAGYLLITDRGRVVANGTVAGMTDVRHLDLQGRVLDAAPAGDGLYLAGADGGVFALGGLPFRGSAAALSLNAPISSIMSTESGYRLAAADGGVFAFGSRFLGSMGGIRLNRPVVAMDGTDDGYWLAARDGGVFSFGLPFYGSLGHDGADSELVDFVSIRDAGYSLLTGDGTIHHFGLPARWHGDTTVTLSCS